MIEKGYEEKVLDHGYVKLIDWMGDDLSSLRAARMSTKNPTGEDEGKDDKLRTRLWKDLHTSPFEMAELVVEMQLPIFCLRQADRHRTLDYSGEGDLIETQTVDQIIRKYMNRNEFSGRYAVMEDLVYLPDVDRIMGKDPNNKQSSIGLLPSVDRNWFVMNITSLSRQTREFYEEAVQRGVANELARLVLPMNQYTRIQLKGDLLSWFKTLDLRLRKDVQVETRRFFQVIGRIIKAIWPKHWEVFEEHTLYGTRFSRSELQLMRALMDQHPSFHSTAPEVQAYIDSIKKKVSASSYSENDLLTAP